MIATKTTRNHSLPGQALGIIAITLGIALAAFTAYAALSIGAAGFAARGAGGPPVLPPGGSVAGPSTHPSATADPTQSATPAPDPTPTAEPTPATTTAPVTAPTPASAGKLIVVSIVQQRLTAYENGAAVLTTVVATGRPELATPTGTFHVMAKYAPYKFVSPWPKGDRYWYPTEWVSYAMLFADDGFFLHDAPWRTVYGPGANLSQGTHGCVNVPLAVMARLYAWASVGTTVIVQ